MKLCSKCKEDKELVEFYLTEAGKPRSRCKTCFKKSASSAVSKNRRTTKEKLIEIHGGKCLDCLTSGPPFIFDFDHRNPEEKKFTISNNGMTRNFNEVLEESLKCDLVCATCHRVRTHKQRCLGCKYCI